MVPITLFYYSIPPSFCQDRLPMFSPFFPLFFQGLHKFSTPVCGKLFGFFALIFPLFRRKLFFGFLRLPKIKNGDFHPFSTGFPQVFHRAFSLFFTKSPIFFPRFDAFFPISVYLFHNVVFLPFPMVFHPVIEFSTVLCG